MKISQGSIHLEIGIGLVHILNERGMTFSGLGVIEFLNQTLTLFLDRPVDSKWRTTPRILGGLKSSE